MNVHVEPLTGPALRDALPGLARLRIEVFRDYPYLYDGDLDYEHRYLERFAACSDALIAGAFDGDDLVGAATAAPLVTQQDSFQHPFRGRGTKVEEVFYFGESVLLPQYRGLGVGHKFFDERESHARAFDGIRLCAFCAVDRPEDHPARPEDYRPLERFWRKRGYEPVAGAIAHFPWREVGGGAEVEHPMQFWMREL